MATNVERMIPLILENQSCILEALALVMEQLDVHRDRITDVQRQRSKTRNTLGELALADCKGKDAPHGK